MKLASQFQDLSFDDIKPLLNGGSLTIYSVARPRSADLPVERSAALATFTLASPAFGPEEGLDEPVFVALAVPASGGGTPGFARLATADGTIVADLSAGPGQREVKFTEVSFSRDAPAEIAAFHLLPEESWPEKPAFYHTSRAARS
ncbi:hypothetical protein DLJ53_15955 [Acuticoccus sediminis]|uniref:Uncharacterized protein n=1 Tax=Acuticoccus sediminis TaxID=2184697 RepID=A0A8B2NQZ8_9HYPH|nr:hypothetical protein [Acuticoccus sediminis]RAI00740.1 hypothetical protein DLJ53_15955 [Acuticoccus sediminis]